uniref:Uncharacterized protein n=1 Tax=Dicentrarchus labrax TaxID=13489 RepID=A0A8C4H1H3_DICLA
VVQRWSKLQFREQTTLLFNGYRIINCGYKYNEIPPDDVPHEKEKGISSISVKELDTFLQTPEAALHAAHYLVLKLNLLTFQLVIEVLQKDPDDLDHRQDQRAKSQGACGNPPTDISICEDGEGRDIFRLLEGPVIRGEGPRQSDLAQGRHKVGAPEEEEHIVELEQDEVFVVEGLPTIEGKQALCVECLEKKRDGRPQVYI